MLTLTEKGSKNENARVVSHVKIPIRVYGLTLSFTREINYFDIYMLPYAFYNGASLKGHLKGQNLLFRVQIPSFKSSHLLYQSFLPCRCSHTLSNTYNNNVKLITDQFFLYRTEWSTVIQI